MPNPTGMLKKGDGDETDNKKVLEFVPYKTAPKNQNHHIIPDIYGPTNVKYSGCTDRAHGKFFECAESSVMEFNLHQFSSWYRTLRFAKAFNNASRPSAIDDGGYRFHFKVWILNPRYAELNPNQELKNKFKLEWGQSLATTFYKRVFATNPNDLRSVEHAVQNDWTVLILTTKLPSQMDPPKSFEGLKRRAIVLVVGAVTFREGRLPVSTSVRPALISWLAVADFYYHNEGGPGPSALGRSSWRRQGFALFLIIHVIKRCSVVKGGYVGDFPIPVAVYLQCTVKLSVQFYMSCGFVRINNKNKDDDGFDCLPESLQQALLERAPPSLFIKYDHSNGHPPCRLMMLRPGSLRQPNTDESIILEESNDVIVLTDSDTSDANNNQQQDWERVWCRYPSPKRGCEPTRYIISGSQMRKAHENLNELNNLLPLPARPLLPHGALRIHGFVGTNRRIEHSKEQGTKWLDIGEIDMMLALLLRDGRYDDSATILPMAYAQTIAAGFDAHVRYVEMLELENQTTKKFIDKNMAVPLNATKTAIMEKFGTSADVIHNSFHCAVNNVIEKIIAPSPGILAKCLIVIPQRMNNNHWVATFVFNASNIGRSSEDDNNNDIIEFPEDVTAACFYQYCPLGKKAFPEAFGTRWFLNLAYSYMKHMEQQGNTSLDLGGINSKDYIQDMEWLYPFGNHLQGYHKGTKVFPHLQFDKTDSLPLQQDGYNCGVGVVAAVGIILRDIIGSTLESENRFYNIFEQSKLSLTLEGNGLWQEWVVKLQPKLLKPLPSPAHLVWGDYLSILRSQWFVLFDRLAELQNVTIPNHVENLPLWYVNVRRQLEWPDNLFNMTRRPAKKNAPYSEDKQTDAAVRSLMCLGSTTKLGHGPDDDWQTSNKELLVDRHNNDDDDRKTTEQTPRQKRKRNVCDKNPGKKVVENIASSEVMESLSDVNVLSSKLIRAKDSQKQLVLSVGGKHSLRKQPKRDYTETFVQLKTRSEKQKAQERFLRWWRKEKEAAKTVINNVVDSHQGTKSIPIGVVTREQFLVSPKSVVAYSKYIASISQTTPDHKNVWHEPFVDIESREAFVQRSFKSWDWHDEDEFLCELQRRRKLAEDASCRKEKFFHFAIHRAMKKERKFYRQQLEAEYMCSVDACLESVKYEHETGCFTGHFSYKTLTDVNSEDEVYNHTDMPEVVPDVVYHHTDMPVDEQWVRQAFSKEVVDQIMSFDSGNADGFVPVPQTARNVAPTRINHLPIVRVCYVHPTVRCVPNIDCDETEVTESSWSNKKFVPVSGYWKGRHANGSTIRVEEKELRSKFGDAYVDQVKNMRCGFMDIPVGEYKVSQLHKYPHLRVLGAPTLRYIQCGGKDLCASKSLASALHRLGFLREAAIINDFGETHLEENLTETIKRLRIKVSTVLPSWIQPKVMPLGFNWESDLDDRTIFVGVLLASDGHCNHAVTIHGKWVYDANETIALPLMRETLDYCTTTETRKSTFRGFWRGVCFQYIGTKKERISRLTVLPP